MWQIGSRTVLHRVVMVLVLAILVAAPLAASAQAIPSAQILSRAVQEAYEKFKDVKEGANADYIPELAKVPSELFGVAIVTARGDVYTAGDVDYAFTIQSVSKPFTAALVMQEQGSADVISDKIGVEPTGLPFNSILATQILKPVSVNPLVNSGAIASVSLVKAKSARGALRQDHGLLRAAGGRQAHRDRGCVPVRGGHQPAQPRARLHPVRERPHLLRCDGSGGRLHAAVLDRRDRQAAGRDGRDAGQLAASTRSRTRAWSIRATFPRCWPS